MGNGMISLSLATFLNWAGASETEKRRLYAKKWAKDGKGHDYHWPVKRAVKEFAFEGKSAADAEGGFAKVKVDHKRLSSQNCFDTFVEFFGKSSFFVPPVGFYASPRGLLRIRVAPEFGVIEKEERRLVTLWCNQDELDLALAGAGIYVMQQVLPFGEFADCRCTILDLQHKYWLVSDKLLPKSAEIVGQELAWVDRFIESLASAASPEYADEGVV